MVQTVERKILGEGRLGLHRTNRQAHRAIQKPQSQYIRPKKGCCACSTGTHHGRFLALAKALLRPCLAVFLKLAPIVRWCRVAEMQQGCFQPGRQSIGQYHTFVNQVIAEPGCTPAKQPQHQVGRPTTMADPAPAKLCHARYFIGSVCLTTHGSPDLRCQLLRYALVCVQRQHPIVPRKAERPVLLWAKTRPVCTDFHTSASSPRQFDRAVRATTIDDQHLIGKSNAVKAVCNVGRFIQGDDDDTELVQNKCS